MIDKKIISQRFTKALLSYDTEAIVQKKIIEKLIDYIKQEKLQNINKILEIGCGTGLLSKKIINLFAPDTIYLNDICQEIDVCFKDYLTNNSSSSNSIKFLLGDAEQIIFPNNIDLLISSSTVQWFEDFENFIKKTTFALNKNKYLVFSTFGEDNLKEIKYITGRGLKYYSKENIEHIVSKYYKIRLIQEELNVLFFNSPKEVLLHLKKTGVAAIQNNTFWNKNNLDMFTKSYIENFKHENKIMLTYHPIYVIAEKI